MKIKKVFSREILDSRGLPTVEADVLLSDGSLGRAAVPSGASTGVHEALELRDGDKRRFFGKGVLKAVENVRRILGPAVCGMSPADQSRVDEKLKEADGTENKSRLGANAILAVSLASARAAAESQKIPLYGHIRNLFGISSRYRLPVPQFNILNGGVHADNGLSIQEILILPVGAGSFSQALQWGAEIFQSLKGILKRRGLSVLAGDEGGFAPKVSSSEKAIALVFEAVRASGRKKGEIVLGLDCAASEFFSEEKYRLDGRTRTSSDIVKVYEGWRGKFPLASIEDGLSQDDWEGWGLLTKRLGKKLQLVGDDIFVTNKKRIRRGIEEGAANCVLIKLNQIGTLSETLEAIQMSQEAGYRTVISHRSGETEDTFIADLAVATNAGQIKTGSLSRSERLAKYNRLLRIEEELGRRGRYAGRNALAHV